MAGVQSPRCRSSKSLPLWHHSAHLLRGQCVNCPCFPAFTSPVLYTFRREVGGGGKIISRTFFFPKLLPLPPLTVHTVGSFFLEIHSDPLYAHFGGEWKWEDFYSVSCSHSQFPWKEMEEIWHPQRCLDSSPCLLSPQAHLAFISGVGAGSVSFPNSMDDCQM